MALAEEATPDQPQLGVNGHTALSKLMPDFMRGMCIDRMHAVDGGVVKKILTLLFDNAYNAQPFSLYRHINVINDRLRTIKPPKFIHRMPRTTKDLLHWKASELKHCFFYYSIAVFEGIMENQYFEHYLRLMVAMYILSADVILIDMIDVANDLLLRFVQEYGQLYGERHMSINLHSLLHLPECVRQTGPLWAHTCYEYEDLSGQMLNLVHGTRYIGSRIANGHGHLLKMMRNLKKVQNDNVRKFCLSVKKQSKLIEQVSEDGYAAGSYIPLIGRIPQWIINAFQSSNIPINGADLLKYFRLLKRNELFVSEDYNRAGQTVTCYVKYRDHGDITIGSIRCFIKYFRCQCFQNNCCCLCEQFAIIAEIVNDSVYVAEGNTYQCDTTGILYKCHRNGNVKAINISNLITPCTYIV